MIDYIFTKETNQMLRFDDIALMNVKKRHCINECKSAYVLRCRISKDLNLQNMTNLSGCLPTDCPDANKWRTQRRLLGGGGDEESYIVFCIANLF